MLCLTCTMVSSVHLAHYRVSRAKDWVSVDCGTTIYNNISNSKLQNNIDFDLSRAFDKELWIFKAYFAEGMHDKGHNSVQACIKELNGSSKHTLLQGMLQRATTLYALSRQLAFDIISDWW